MYDIYAQCATHAHMKCAHVCMLICVCARAVYVCISTNASATLMGKIEYLSITLRVVKDSPRSGKGTVHRTYRNRSERKVA